MWARQIGKTFTSTLEIVGDCYQAEAKKRKTRWVILSRGERQAKEAVEEGVKLHAKAIGMGINILEEERKDSDGNTYKALEVEIGKSRITALPASPDTARGFSANVFLDEFAFHKDSRKIWAALFPVVSAGHKLRVVSTPNGKDNKFYELMTGSYSRSRSTCDRWSRHVVDIYRAVKEGLPRNIEELKEALNDEDAWAQEYELKWLDEASAWLSYDLINSVEDDNAGIEENYQGNPCFIGNDIALRGDLWVAWVWEPIGDVLWTREIRVLKRAKFAEQDAVMDELVEKYNMVRLCMDQTGMGEKPVEDAQRRYGESRVEGVLFTSPNKLMLATVGKQKFEDRKVRIPLGDQAIRDDLHKLKKIPTATGGFRFDADRDSSGHADRAWAAFLGLYAGSTPYQKPEYTSVQKRRASFSSGSY